MSNKLFQEVPSAPQQKNSFNLSHDVKMSFNMGQLVPTACIEAVPGDNFKISCENLIKFAPLIAPVLHKIKATTHWFFVPNRILWPEWEDYITQNSEAELPYIVNGDDISVGDLADYMGLPTLGDATVKINALPFAAYVKIWDEYYRAQHIQTERFVELTDGLNSTYEADAYGPPFLRAWNHDYFTSALPTAQFGSAVEIPIAAASVPVTLSGTNIAGQFRKASDGTLVGATTAGQTDAGSSLIANSNPTFYDPTGTLEVDFTANAVDITTLRLAFKMQEYLERLMRGGTRYTEFITSFFGVRSQDSRLQRPEYVGGTKQNVVISEVLATAQETAQIIPVGYQAGHAISVGGGNTFTYNAKEHGYLIGILNVQPVTAYVDQVPKHFLRRDNLDFFLPTFEHIGEQEITNVEVYGPATTNVDGVFGYIPRNAEYKSIPSRVAGDFRTTLSFYHLSREFSAQPVLNSAFIECDMTDINNRIFAVQDDNQYLWAHVYNNIKARRHMSFFSSPRM